MLSQTLEGGKKNLAKRVSLLPPSRALLPTVYKITSGYCFTGMNKAFFFLAPSLSKNLFSTANSTCKFPQISLDVLNDFSQFQQSHTFFITFRRKVLFFFFQKFLQGAARSSNDQQACNSYLQGRVNADAWLDVDLGQGQGRDCPRRLPGEGWVLRCAPKEESSLRCSLSVKNKLVQVGVGFT